MSNKDEIFSYVMNSPENANPAVLRGMLNNLSESSSNNSDYNIETEKIIIIPEQTVTTIEGPDGYGAQLTLSQDFSEPPPTLIVTTNNT